MTSPGLALYHYDGCPFCTRVREAADRLGVSLELRDILESDDHRRELTQSTGSQTVPVLRIEEASGEVRWLPESANIIDYLDGREGT